MKLTTASAIGILTLTATKKKKKKTKTVYEQRLLKYQQKKKKNGKELLKNLINLIKYHVQSLNGRFEYKADFNINVATRM